MMCNPVSMPKRWDGPDLSKLSSATQISAFAPEELALVENLAGQLKRDEPALSDTRAFGPLVRTGLGHGPRIFYEDHSEISLAKPAVSEILKYRIALVAGDGDFVCVASPRNPPFENYMRNVLGLGSPEIISVEADPAASGWPLARRLIHDEDVLNRLAAAARQADGISIIPYLGSGTSWLLAAELAERAKVPVHVAAPPPRLTRRINDKVWFSSQIRHLLGVDALPPTFSVFGPAALAHRVLHLARVSERVVIKVPDSAGSIGNIVVESTTVRRMALDQLHSWLLGFLHNIGWNQTYPLIIGVWEAPVLQNPSVQMWIPHLADGPPVIERITSQAISGEKGEFTGTRQTVLPALWDARIRREATLLATLFQRLAYFGICSMDALITGNAFDHSARLHWIECNGRWGGISIPMILARRLAGDAAFAIIQRRNTSMPVHDIDGALDLLDGLIFSRSKGSGAVLLSPCGGPDVRGLHLMAIAKTTAEAHGISVEAARLFNVSGSEYTH